MKKLNIIGLFLVLPILVSAQYFEGGIFIGGSAYAGDLVEKSIAANQTNLAYGLAMKYNVNDYVTIAAKLYRGTLTGDDANASEQFRLERNLSFESPITEFAVTPEINIMGFNAYDKLFSPFVYAGIAYYRFNPRTFYEGQWYDLQPLGTEGQGIQGYDFRYELNQIAIPFGGGIKFSVSEYWTISFELGTRLTFTDYLDDVSGFYVPRDVLITNSGELTANLADRTWQYLGTEPDPRTTEQRRGNNSIKDWYGFGGITMTYNFLDGFGGGKYGCPTNF